MSALTKLFVVLLIICSLLLAAGVVVFVNRTEEFVKAEQTSKAQIAQLNERLTTAQNDANVARARESKAADDNLKLVGTLRDEANSAKRAADDRAGEVTKKEAEIAVLSAALSEASSALKVAQTNLSSLSGQYNALVKDHDKTRAENAELVGANTDFQKRLEEAQRELDYQLERVQQLTTELASAQRGMAPGGITSNARPRQAAAAPPRVNGVIRDIKDVDGVKYATISLGTADKVQKGMEFNVIDRDANQFLGKLTVETVDQNESFGRLEGPKASDIKQGHAVVSEI